MSKPDLIPAVELVEPRVNPMTWQDEEAASGVFLGPDPVEDPLALLGTPPMQLPERPRLPEDFTPPPSLLDWLTTLQRHLSAAAIDRERERAFELPVDGLDAVSVQAVTEILGEGEVSGSVTLDGVHYAIVESVLPGVWRVCGDDGSDRVEVGAAPTVILDAAASLQTAGFSIPAPDTATMNAPAVLAEIRERAGAWQGEANHVLNFTLLPMTEADQALLIGTLGRADLELNSGGFGECRIMATRYRHVWAVQYVNAMGHTILDTVEIGTLPPAATAAWQDFEDSAERLTELLEAYLP
jgi:hydrogenase-1 operon protein HyaF